MTLSTLSRTALRGLALVALTATAVSAQSSLFTPLDGARVALDARQSGYLTSLESELGVDAVDLVRAEASRLGAASELRVALPDTEVVLESVAAMTRSTGHLSWVGRSDDGTGWGFLVTRDGQITGEIHAGGYVYPIRPLTNGVHAVARKSMAGYQMHPDDYAAFLEADRPRREMLRQAEAEAPQARRASATTVIDVVVPYSQDVEAALADPVALAQSFVDYTNTAYTNSNIDLELNMVVAYETPYTYSGSLSTDLGRIRSGSDGHMDEAHRIREAYGADLVALITGTHTFGVCGIAYVNSGYGTGFSANSSGCGAITFAHEVGHNLGSNHDASTDDDATPGDGINDPVYAYGRGYVNDTGKWGTVMAYNAACSGQLCQMIPYFSNPNVSYTDTTSPVGSGPTGVAATSDNARVHRERMATVAAFDVGGTPPALTTSAASVSASLAAGGTATRQVTVSNSASAGANDLDWFARVQNVDVPGARRAAPGNCASGETVSQSVNGFVRNLESGGEELGQSFVTACRGSITTVTPKFYYNTSPNESWTGTLRIYRGDGTTGEELASGTVSHTNGASGIVDIPIALSAPLDVVAGEALTWFLDLTSGKTSMLFTTSDPDPDGRAYLSFDGDPTRTAGQPSWDMAYQTTYDEPAATWLEVTPVTGSEAAGAGSPFTVAFDATGLAPGTYTAEVAVLTGDATNFEQTVPVTLTVISGALATDDGYGWRMMAFPYDGMTVEALADQNLVQGTPDSYPGAGANLFTSYDGTGWTGAGAHTEAVAPGTGVLWYLFDEAVDPDLGDPDNSVGVDLPMTLTGTGAEPSADVSVSLHADGDGWNLLGNPFLLGLDVSGANAWTGAGNLQSFVGQVWQCTPNAASPVECVGSYVTTTSLGDVVPAWSGVFFDAASAGTLTIPISARGATTRRATARMLNFELASADGSALDRAATVVFRDGAEAGWDGWDAEKLASLASPSVQIAFGGERDGEALLKAQDSRPLDPATLEIPVYVASAGAGQALVLTWPRLDGIPADWALTLTDHETNETVDLRGAESYAFEVTESAARTAALPGASARVGDAPRFTLTVRTANAVSTETDAPAETWLGTPYPNPSSASATVPFGLAEAGTARLTLVDLLGREVAVLADGDLAAGDARATLPAAGLAPGLYVVRLEAGDRVLTRRAVVVR